eukprot:TRINITY_DN5470_c0_g2_i5.p1 TRINITY_DN5470_c0_g2~~TRINITY_DN5470_c0_g2_i5.p1  ORF type:complete len:175 (-),score=30.87 TRINITY_DN5470_c0_g2_i5:10-534(-)
MEWELKDFTSIILSLVLLLPLAVIYFAPGLISMFWKKDGLQRMKLCELEMFDGSDSQLPIFVSLKGKVYDVSDGPYSKKKKQQYCDLSGKEIGYAMALNQRNLAGDFTPLSTLTKEQRKTLKQVEKVYERKYKQIGQIVDLPKGYLEEEPKEPENKQVKSKKKKKKKKKKSTLR